MKSFYFAIALFLITFNSFGQVIAFPDAAFKNALVTTLCATPAIGLSIAMDVDSNNDGEITVNEAEAIGSLDVSNRSISNLEGLAYFRNLYRFYCNNNQLTSIDVSSLTALYEFTCYGNLITQITLCGTAVAWFDCNSNPNLTYISVKNNVVSVVIAGRNPNSEPPVGMLNFSNCPQLTTICHDEGEYYAAHYSVNYMPITYSTDCILNCSSLAIPDRNVGAAFVLAPNPVVDFLTVQSIAAIQSITIDNLLGQQLHVFTYSNFEKKTDLDVSALPSGTYLVNLVSTVGKNTQKLIKI